MSLIKVLNLIDKYAKLSLIDKKYLVVFDHKSNRAQIRRRIRAGMIPYFISYLTIPELCSILDTRYLCCKSSLYKLKLQICIRKKINN